VQTSKNSGGQQMKNQTILPDPQQEVQTKPKPRRNWFVTLAITFLLILGALSLKYSNPI
jgi:hypothetical protein